MSTDFVSWYIRQGFGWASKADIDTFAFHMLMEDEEWSTLSVYELSNRLGITESRVKSLMLRAHIKYSAGEDQDPVRELARLINANKVEYILERHEVRFQVDDPILRREFEHQVRSSGGFLDTSFNRDVLRMSVGTFVRLLNKRSPAFERRFKTISAEWLKSQDDATKKAIKKAPLSVRVERYLEDHKGKLGLLKDAISAAVGLG